MNLEIAICLVLVAFALPYLYLHKRMRDSHQSEQRMRVELQLLKQQKREMELTLARDRSLILDTLGVAYLLIRPNGNLVLANREANELMGLADKQHLNLLEELADHPLREILTHARHLKQSQIYTMLLSAGGQEKVMRVRCTPLPGDEHHLGIICHDMTEMHRTLVIRREFIANASHELRTPLTIVRGYLENLLESPSDAQDAELRTHALQLMQKHTDRIVRLVDDMLTISRLENPESRHMSSAEFNLQSVIQDARQQLESMIAKQGAKLEIDVEPAELSMQGDRFYWGQIFFNLMENALKNNPNAPLSMRVSARISQESGSEKIRIVVADAGRGIRSESLPYIFNRFYRADTTGKIKGTGLGLSIVRNAVEAHGGTIRVESEPGILTAFIINAPRIAPFTR